ncbi:MAG: hypothetical protein EOP42_22535 [Sphingobacteriaceae bacterium]|nr:MAG: hypothetical protein EOP42_22535 [Sphingobacteriaceae bacterium]
MNTLEKAISITNVSFNDENTLVLHLSNKRSVLIPLDDFPDIAALNTQERGDFQIIDHEYLSFLTIDEIYSLKELIG